MEKGSRQMPKRLITGLLLALVVWPVHAQQVVRSTTIGDKPDFNGIWQAINTANWNLEAHSAEALDEFWKLGAIAAIPDGRCEVRGRKIPSLPAPAEERDSDG